MSDARNRRPALIPWLYTMFRLRRAFHDRDLLFSQRRELMRYARPHVGTMHVVEYPDAIMFIRPDDVTRGIQAAKEYR